MVFIVFAVFVKTMYCGFEKSLVPEGSEKSLFNFASNGVPCFAVHLMSPVTVLTPGGGACGPGAVRDINTEADLCQRTEQL